MSESPTLVVDGLGVHFGSARSRKQVLRSVSFSVAPGEAIGVIGETGSGKSTIARTVLGLVRPSSGSVTIDGQEVSRFSQRQWRSFRRSGVAQYVFQDPQRSLDPDLTVRESVAEPLFVQGGRSRAEVNEAVRQQFDVVKLESKLLDRLPAELSGGQRQRVAIARALITSPKLLILDEPVSALDSANRVKILGLLSELRLDEVALVFISHDLGSVAGITDRTIVLYQGEIVESAPTSRIINAPQHPYARLLVGSAPTLTNGSISIDERAALRRELVG